MAKAPGQAGCEVLQRPSTGLRQPPRAADEGIVRIFARLLSRLAAAAPLPRRTLAGAVAMSACAALLTAAPAGAIVETVGATKVGLQPRNLAFANDGAMSGEFRDFGGGPILPSTNTYVIYWDPAAKLHGNWEHIVDVFMQSMGAESGSLADVFAVDSQYTDPANRKASYQSSFHGAYTDTNHYPSSGNCTDPAPLHGGKAITCVTDKQIREQLETFLAQHKLPKGIEDVYYLLTPPGVGVCLEAGHCSDYPATPEEIEAIEAEKSEPEAYEIYKHSFCSYHSAINPNNATNGDASTVLYAVIPWIARGEGDYHLALQDQKQAYDCQDGGFLLNEKNSVLEKEHPTITTKEEAEKRLAAEEKENKELTAAEEQHTKGLITQAELETKEKELKAARAVREAEEKKAREAREKSEGPHEQEPNQDGLGEDGSYDDGLADLLVSQIGVEQQNIVTDPLLNGWQDTAGNESTDECRNVFALTRGGSASALPFTEAGTLSNQTFAGVNAYINDAFDLAAEKREYPGVPCLNGVNLKPQFTAPNPVNAGEVVGFDGMESDITLDAGTHFTAKGEEETTYPVFTWNFGDGSPEVSGFAPGAPSLNSPEATPCETPWLSPCAASTYHTYQYGGKYTVTLTVTDVGGNTTSVAREVTVVGAPRPSASGGSSSGASTSTSTSSTTAAAGAPSTAGGAAPAGHAPVPPPVAAAAIVKQTLHNAIHKGLVVSYSVNEQVAGHFEVLLSSATAHRLGIGGAPAAGLPAGSPTEVVIAKAILVTTKGGHSAVHIAFSKRTAARLARAHKVSLMLRLVVRNAATANPLTTSVVSSVTLTG